MVKSFLRQETVPVHQRTKKTVAEAFTRFPDLKVQKTEERLEYITLPRGTVLYKGVEECYLSDDRPGINPIWFGQAEDAIRYATKSHMATSNVCVYETQTPLRLMLINKNNIRRMYLVAMKIYEAQKSPAFIQDWYQKSEALYPSNLPDPPKAPPRERVNILKAVGKSVIANAVLPDSLAKAYGAYTLAKISGEMLERLLEASESFYNWTQGRKDPWEARPERRGWYQENLKWSRSFCESIAPFSKALQLDGYYSLPVAWPESRGANKRHHQEIMLCNPFDGDKLKLSHKVPVLGTGRGNMTGTVKTASDLDEEVETRERAKAFLRPKYSFLKKKRTSQPASASGTRA
jgi:hypothetical protein